jgi:hypothetical protein
MTELMKLLTMSEKEVLRYVAEKLRTVGHVDTDGDNYLMFKTGHAMCLMAHVDTVHITKCDPVMENKIIRNKLPHPLGADDRAGVYAILEVVNRLKFSKHPLPNIILTNYEETGGAGAKALIKSGLLTGDEFNLILALDRRGANDWVEYASNPKVIHEYVERFGFIPATGSYSDVADLNNAYRIPGVNLSVGYYSQHTLNERLHLDELYLTISRVYRMCREPMAERHNVIEVKQRWGKKGKYNGGYGGYDYYDRDWDNDANWPPAKKGEADVIPLSSFKKVPQYFLQDLTHEAKKTVRQSVEDKIATKFKCGHFAVKARVCPDCKALMMYCRCGHVLSWIRAEFLGAELEMMVDTYFFRSDPIFPALLETTNAQIEAEEAFKKLMVQR